MKKIGILFAMKEELEALLKHLKLNNKYKIFDLEFYECSYLDMECVLVESGIGKVNAARCTQIMIDNMEVDYIFNIGIAGGVDDKLSICDIVVGEKLVQHDFDLTAFNYEKGQIPNTGKFIESDDYLVKTALDKNNIKDYTVYPGVIASGDIFCTEKYMSDKINKKFGALCVEMEGASVAHVCFLSHIPFLIIRSISDSPNKGNNKMDYDKFINISCNNVASYMINILTTLNNELKD